LKITDVENYWAFGEFVPGQVLFVNVVVENYVHVLSSANIPAESLVPLQVRGEGRVDGDPP
jgi:hypothetical protein